MSGAFPTVSVVIPVKNGFTTLAAQLESLIGQLDPSRDEIIVADNGSTDGTRRLVDDFAHRNAVRIRWVDASRIPGVSHARNSGLAAASGEYLLICDADDVVHPNWVAAMQEGLRSAEMVGGSLEVESLNSPAAVAVRPLDSVDSLPSLLGFLPYAVGCNVGIRRTVALSVGGWDESLRAGGDDVDFSWRVQLAGFRLSFAPAAKVAYRLRDTLRGALRQAYAYGRAETGIYRKYVLHGLRVPSTPHRVKAVGGSALALIRVAGKRESQGRALFVLALNAGKLLATLEFRLRNGGAEV